MERDSVCPCPETERCVSCSALLDVFFVIRVSARGLRSRARFEQEKMRRDWNSFPELAEPGRD